MSMTDEEKKARSRFIEDNPISSVLEAKGVKIPQGHDSVMCLCPLHEDKNPSLSVKISTNEWKCFAGCGEGGVIDLIAKFENLTPLQLLKREGIIKNGTTEDSPKNEFKVDWSKCVSDFTDDHKEKLAQWRGYRREFVDLLVSNRMVGLYDGKLALPVISKGVITGVHFRTDKSWVIKGGSQKLWIIGEHQEDVFLFESQWDAFAFMDSVRWFEKDALRMTACVAITRGASNGKLVQGISSKSRVYCWMQNDPLAEDGSSPAEKWLGDVVKILGTVQLCRPPEGRKDLNEWTKAGATTSDVVSVVETSEKYRDPKLPPIKSSLDFRKMIKFDPSNDDNCLLGNRYLCRGGSAIWVGGSGLGKSVMTLQAAISFALGMDLFGLKPKRPLRSVILSAEDDEGDISETLQGVLKGMGVSENDPRFTVVEDSVKIYQENTLKGLPLIGMAEQVVTENKADLIWINPLLSYYAGNPSDPEKSSEFTGALSSMQTKTGVCTMLIHHTGKPRESTTTASWSVDDFSYIGLGSSVWTNWARAILVLQSLKEPKDTFAVKFAKRGQRSGIINANFEKVREIFLQHSKTGLCWIPSEYTPSGEEQTVGRPKKSGWAKMFEVWDGSGKTSVELKDLMVESMKISDKTAGRNLSDWAGVHLFKHADDLWYKTQ